MRPRCPSNSSSNFSKRPNRSSCSSSELSVSGCMKVGLPFCKQQVECLNVYQNQLLKILDWTCETGAPMFLLTKKPFFLIGILILSQLIVGIAVENLNSTPRSRIISRPMMISYSSVFCLGVLSTLKL